MRLTGRFYDPAEMDAALRRPYGGKIKSVHVNPDPTMIGMWRWTAELEQNPEEK